MKKQLMIAVVTLIPALSFAKIADFNDMIKENAQAQSALSETVQHSVKTARVKPRERIVIVETKSHSYNSPTTKRFAFEKERTYNRASEKKQFERVASEVTDAE